MKTITIKHADGSIQTQIVEDTFEGPLEQDGISAESLRVGLTQIEVENCLKFLAETDWYVARKNETGAEIPEEIRTKREEARIFISNNRNK